MTRGKSYHFHTNLCSINAATLSAHHSNLQNSQTSQGYIFLILQHFATKLGNITTFKMLFQAVAMNVVPPAWIKIYVIMLIVHLR